MTTQNLYLCYSTTITPQYELIDTITTIRTEYELKTSPVFQRDFKPLKLHKSKSICDYEVNGFKVNVTLTRIQ